jgi:hypothetical protein
MNGASNADESANLHLNNSTSQRLNFLNFLMDCSDWLDVKRSDNY